MTALSADLTTIALLQALAGLNMNEPLEHRSILDMTTNEMPLKLWWIPQIPMKAFEVEIASLAEGVKLLDVLANYDIFQFENNVKPDYCNAGGIVMLEDGEWVDWYDEASGEDDPKAFVAALVIPS